MDSVFDEVKELPQKEFRALKFLWHITAHHFMWDDGSFYRILEESGKVGLTVFCPCRNGEILNFLRDECVKKGQLAPKYHYVSRPPFTEAEGVRRAIYLAQQTGTPLYVVHVTCKEAFTRNTGGTGKRN